MDLVARPAAAAAEVKGMADRLHDRTQFRTRALFLQVRRLPRVPFVALAGTHDTVLAWQASGRVGKRARRLAGRHTGRWTGPWQGHEEMHG